MIRNVCSLAAMRIRADFRAPFAHALRLWLGVAMLAVVVEAHETGRAFGAPGLRMFSLIFGLDVLAIVMIAAFGFATTVTTEREQATLPLLAAAGFRPVEVFLGNVASRVVGAATILLVQAPFVLLAVTLGGVATGHLLRMLGVLLAFLLLAAAVGGVASCWCRTSARAIGATAAVLAVIVVGGAALDELEPRAATLGLDRASSVVADVLHTVSPLDAFTTLASEPAAFGDVIAAMLATGVVLVLLAALGLREVDRPAAPSKARRRRPITGNALTWKDVEFGTGGRRGVATRAAGHAVLAAVVGTVASSRWNPHAGIVAIVALLVATTVDLSVFAVRAFRAEVEERTLPLLLLAPTLSHPFDPRLRRADRLVECKLAAGSRVLLPALGVALVVFATVIAPAVTAHVSVWLWIGLGLATIAMCGVAGIAARIALGDGPRARFGFVTVLALWLSLGFFCCGLTLPVLVIAAPFFVIASLGARVVELGGEL